MEHFNVIAYCKTKKGDKPARRHLVHQLSVESTDGIILDFVYEKEELLQLLMGKSVVASHALGRGFITHNDVQGKVVGILLLNKEDKEKLVFQVEIDGEITQLNPESIFKWISDPKPIIDYFPPLKIETDEALEKQDELSTQDVESFSKDFLSPAQRAAVEDLKSIGEDREPVGITPSSMIEVETFLQHIDQSSFTRSGSFYVSGALYDAIDELLLAATRSQAAGKPKKVIPDLFYGIFKDFFNALQAREKIAPIKPLGKLIKQYAEETVELLEEYYEGLEIIAKGSETTGELSFSSHLAYEKYASKGLRGYPMSKDAWREGYELGRQSVLNNQPEERKNWGHIYVTDNNKSKYKFVLADVLMKELSFVLDEGVNFSHKSDPNTFYFFTSTERPAPKKEKKKDFLQKLWEYIINPF